MARERKRNRRRPQGSARQPAERRPGDDGVPDFEPSVPEAVGPAVPPVGETPLAPEPIAAGEELEFESATPRAGAAAAKPSGNRVAAFMRASWAELQRVQWPDRRQVGQATAVVLGFVVIAGSFLGLADLLASNLVDALL
ncbi:MAG: hypothetical protein NVSMB51_10750 [Solirubrobacteraceae bacterium]